MASLDALLRQQGSAEVCIVAELSLITKNPFAITSELDTPQSLTCPKSFQSCQRDHDAENLARLACRAFQREALASTWRPKGPSKSVISRVITGVSPLGYL